MRKYLLLLVILIRSSYGQAQSTTDTICLSVSVFKKVYSSALQKKYADSLLTITEKQVNELLSAIDLLEEKDVELKKQYDAQISNLNNQINIFKDQVKGYELLIKKERRRRRLATAGGVLTTGAAIFLLLKK